MHLFSHQPFTVASRPWNCPVHDDLQCTQWHRDRFFGPSSFACLL